MGNYSCRNLILTALRDTGEVQERVDLQETAAPQSKVSPARRGNDPEPEPKL